MWKCLIWCVVLVLLENLSLSDGAPWCCVDVLTNGSANYTLNTTGCEDYIWNLNETCIKDENGDKDDNTVIMYGPNSILLYRHYSGVNYVCMDDSKEDTPVQCSDRCVSGKADLKTEGPVLSTWWTAALISVTIIIIIFIFIILIIIGWNRGWYRRCRGNAANRREANNANHANGGFQAVDQEESGV